MIKLVLVGSGAVASEITSYVEHHNKNSGILEAYYIAGYIDFDYNIEKYWRKYKLIKPVLGDIDTYKIEQDDHFIIAVSDLPFRWEMIQRLEQKNAMFANFIHFTSMVDRTATLGKGNIIYPHCIIGPNCSLGNFNILTSYSFISHDCRVGENNFFATAGLSGHVKVGDHNMFGIRSTVLPRLTVGSNNQIQAGMTVDKDLQNCTTVFYRYKEKVYFSGTGR